MQGMIDHLSDRAGRVFPERGLLLQHLLPILAFIFLASGFYAYNYRQYSKDPEGRGGQYTFHGTFLKGRYDQGIYRGIGVTCYRDGNRAGWYPGASIFGGIFWRLAGSPSERSPQGYLFFIGYYIPSMLAGLGYFYFFYRFAVRRWGVKAAVLSLISLLTFGPSFYYLTAFPYNLGLVCMSAYLLLYDSKVKGRLIWLGLLGWYCSITYPSAFLFVLYPLVAEACAQYKARSFKLVPYIAYGLPFALGPLMFYTYLYFMTGDFLAYVNYQGANYGRDFGNPIAAVTKYLFSFPLNYPENYTTLMVLFYFALFANKRIGLPMWVYMLALIFFSPMTGSYQCVYRHYLLAFPIHYLMGTSDRNLAVKILMAAIGTYFCVKVLFHMYLVNGLT